MSALVLLAQGSEEIEAVVVIDVLRRAKVKVTVAVVDPAAETGLNVVCSRGVKLVADCKVSDIGKVEEYGAIVMPGGLQGAKTFSTNAVVQSLLLKFHAAGKFVCAICAGPMAISKAKIAPGSKITSHPVAKNDLLADYQYQEHSPVVQDGNLITSRCPGTSFDFALAIVTALTDQATAESVKHGLYT